MGPWLRSYGWKFVLAFIVAALALAYIIRADRRAHGEAAVGRPAVAALIVSAGARG